MSFNQKIIIGMATSLACSASFAGPMDLYRLKHVEEQQAQSYRAAAANVTEAYYDQLIDHHNPKLGTYKQRYYIDETFAQGKDAPVFFYICGEAACSANSIAGGEIRVQAEKNHGVLVALEHRYYGKSMPTKTLSSKDLRFLTTENALKDLDRFQHDMAKEHGWAGKWVSFGGSYPGSLSAYYRLQYPKNVAGSLASSAPVQAKENFEGYDAHVTAMAGPKCVAKIREAYREVENSLDNPQAMARIKHSFQLDALKDSRELLFLMADIGSAAVQYGFKDMFCGALEHAETPLAGTAMMAKQLYAVYGIKDPIRLTTQGLESENIDDYDDRIGVRQWMYQTCTEYGYWQVAHHDPKKSSRSPMITVNLFREACDHLFNLKKPANVESINRRFYKPLQEDASNIYFTNGSTDPWSRLSLTATNHNNGNEKLTYYTIKGAAHCDDLRPAKATDSAELKQARKTLSGLVKRWLA